MSDPGHLSPAEIAALARPKRRILLGEDGRPRPTAARKRAQERLSRFNWLPVDFPQIPGTEEESKQRDEWFVRLGLFAGIFYLPPIVLSLVVSVLGRGEQARYTVILPTAILTLIWLVFFRAEGAPGLWNRREWPVPVFWQVRLRGRRLHRLLVLLLVVAPVAALAGAISGLHSLQWIARCGIVGSCSLLVVLPAWFMVLFLRYSALGFHQYLPNMTPRDAVDWFFTVRKKEAAQLLSPTRQTEAIPHWEDLRGWNWHDGVASVQGVSFRLRLNGTKKVVDRLRARAIVTVSGAIRDHTSDERYGTIYGPWEHADVVRSAELELVGREDGWYIENVRFEPPE